MPGKGLSPVISIVNELRAAAATARRQPIFTAFTVLILAFGIGASIAIFSVVDGVLLRQLPYKDPDRLVWLWALRSDGTRGAFAMQDVVDLRERTTAFDAIAAMGQWSVVTATTRPDASSSSVTASGRGDSVRTHACSGGRWRSTAHRTKSSVCFPRRL